MLDFIERGVQWSTTVLDRFHKQFAKNPDSKLQLLSTFFINSTLKEFIAILLCYVKTHLHTYIYIHSTYIIWLKRWRLFHEISHSCNFLVKIWLSFTIFRCYVKQNTLSIISMYWYCFSKLKQNPRLGL